MGSVRFSDFPANGPFSENFWPQGGKSRLFGPSKANSRQFSMVETYSYSRKSLRIPGKWQLEWEMDNFGQKGGIFELKGDAN